MKKIISVFISALMTSSVLFVPSAMADDVSTLYFKSGENTDIIKVSAEDVANGDVTVRIGMYIDDSSNDIASLQLKWGCDSEYITLGNLLNPALSVNEETEYSLSDGTSFTTSMIPSCFGKVSNGKLSFQGTFFVPDKPDENTGRSEKAYSISYQSAIKNAVQWLDDDSDAYMISDFDAVISQGTPEGFYTIYYAEPEDPNNITSDEWLNISYCTYYSVSKDFIPETKSITIQVGEPVMLGDVNQDGVINASDASCVLAAYAAMSSNGDSGLSDSQLIAADVNKDGIINASDASRILNYYSNISSGIDDEF